MTAMKVVPVEPGDEVIEAICAANAGATWPDGYAPNAQMLRRNRAKEVYKAPLSAVEPAPDGLVKRWDASIYSHQNEGGTWSAGIDDSSKWGHRIQVHADTVEEAEALRDQVLAALTSRAAVDEQPVAWVRFCSDGTYEGPLMDCAIEDVRKKSGAWTPLYKPASRAAVLEEAAIIAMTTARREIGEPPADCNIRKAWGYAYAKGGNEMSCDIAAAIRAAKGE